MPTVQTTTMLTRDDIIVAGTDMLLAYIAQHTHSLLNQDMWVILTSFHDDIEEGEVTGTDRYIRTLTRMIDTQLGHTIVPAVYAELLHAYHDILSVEQHQRRTGAKRS